MCVFDEGLAKTREDVKIVEVESFSSQLIAEGRDIEPLITDDGSEIKLWILDNFFATKRRENSTYEHLLGFFVVDPGFLEKEPVGFTIHGPNTVRIGGVGVEKSCGEDCFIISIVRRNCANKCDVTHFFVDINSSAADLPITVNQK